MGYKFCNLKDSSFCSQIKCWLSGLELTKCLSEIANREDTDQTVSLEAFISINPFQHLVYTGTPPYVGVKQGTKIPLIIMSEI